jgi:hypothetical protein
MSKRYAMVILLFLTMLMGVGIATAASTSEATPVVVSWAEYATYDGESIPHAYMEYRLVKVEATATIVCAQQEVDTGLDAFDAPGSDEILVPPPPPWDLEGIPCFGELEEQTRLVWRTIGEPPLYGVPLPEQEDRGDGWIAHGTVNTPDVPTAVEIASFTVQHQGQTALVEWETASEVDLIGFNLVRDGAQINDELIPAYTPGAPIGALYTLVDQHPGTQYWLEAMDANGCISHHGPAIVRYLQYIPVGFQNTTQP